MPNPFFYYFLIFFNFFEIFLSSVALKEKLKSPATRWRPFEPSPLASSANYAAVATSLVPVAKEELQQQRKGREASGWEDPRYFRAQPDLGFHRVDRQPQV